MSQNCAKNILHLHVQPSKFPASNNYNCVFSLTWLFSRHLETVQSIEQFFICRTVSWSQHLASLVPTHSIPVVLCLILHPFKIFLQISRWAGTLVSRQDLNRGISVKSIENDSYIKVLFYFNNTRQDRKTHNSNAFNRKIQSPGFYNHSLVNSVFKIPDRGHSTWKELPSVDWFTWIFN